MAKEIGEDTAYPMKREIKADSRSKLEEGRYLPTDNNGKCYGNGKYLDL